MGVCSDQPLAKGKGVHSEVESGGRIELLRVHLAKFRPEEHEQHQAQSLGEAA